MIPANGPTGSETGSGVAPAPSASAAPGWVRSIEAAAIAGVVFAVLALVGVALLLDLTDAVDSRADAASWVRDDANQRTQVVALNLIAISSIAFVWFVAVIRRRVGEHEDRFFGTVFLGSGMVFVAIWLAGATAMTAPAFALTYFGDASVSSATTSYAAGLGGAYLWVVLPRIAGLFVLSTATIIRRTRVLPTWLAVASLAVGVALLVVPMIAGPIGFVFPGWVLLVSVTILIARREQRQH